MITNRLHPEGDFVCSACGKRWLTRQGLEEHRPDCPGRIEQGDTDMSEAFVIPEPVAAQNMGTDLATEPQFPCPKCDRVFHTSNQLGGHLSSAHRDKHEKVPCPECGEMFQPGVGLASHRSRRHGVPGVSKSAKLRNEVREKEAERKRKARARARTQKIDAVEPHEWDVDDIFETVVATLWTEGTIPVSAVIPLIHWREATRQLLESVTQQNTQT